MQYDKTSYRCISKDIISSSMSSSESFSLLQRKTTQVNLHIQKDVISTQKQPSCKKSTALCKMARVKKVVKYKCQPRNDCDGRAGQKF